MSKNVIKWESRHGLYLAGVAMVDAVAAYWLPKGVDATREAVRETVDVGEGTRNEYDAYGVSVWLIMLAEWGYCGEASERYETHADCPEFHIVGYTKEWACGSHNKESDGYRRGVQKV